MEQLPTGKVKTGSDHKLELTDGWIQKGREYVLPPTEDGKTTGKTGRVTNIQMSIDLGTNKISFWVRLQELTGQGWQFEYHLEKPDG